MSKPNPRKSKCWTCKHGLCFSEEEGHRITSLPMEGPQIESDYGSEFSLDQEELDSVSRGFEQTVKQEHARAVCYWRPQGHDQGYPVLVNEVQECNRYEKDTTRRTNE